MVQIKQSIWIPLGFGSDHFCRVGSEGRHCFEASQCELLLSPVSSHKWDGTCQDLWWVSTCQHLPERTALKNEKTMENGLLTTLKTCETSVILQKNPVIFTHWSCPPWLRLGKRPIQCYILIIFNTKTFAVLFKIQLSFRLCSAGMFSSKTDCWGWQEQSEKAALTFLPDTSIVTPTVGN